MASEKSKILVVGATGHLGKFMVEGSVRCGHPTFALVRDTAPSDPAKAKILEDFKSAGVTLLKADLNDHESLVKALKQVDVVISVVGTMQAIDQLKLIAAAKEAGTIKRFVPSDFGVDVERSQALEPCASMVFGPKIQVRKALQAQGIPYTVVSCNCFAGYTIPVLAQVEPTGPPTDKVVILGDGTAKVVFVAEEDIATYTIKAVDDPRTLNKILYLRPAANIYSQGELVALWEKKTGKTLEKTYVPEEEVVKKAAEAPIPLNIFYGLAYSVFIKGDNANFEIESSFGVEATELYPEVKYTTVEEYLGRILQ